MAADGMPVSSFVSELSRPFPDSAISWRIGATNHEKTKGMALAYIDARDVMERLDEVVGPGNWQDAYEETPKGRVLCTLSVRIGAEWVHKSDGAGETDVESEKGAISDALKRAAVKWGVGRYLYNLDSPWVEIEVKGKSSIMKAGERKKLDNVHRNHVHRLTGPIITIPDAGTPDAGQREMPEAQQAAGAGTPKPAPVQTMSKADSRAEFSALQEEIRNCPTAHELKQWGALNAKRVALMDKSFQVDLRKAYGEMLEGLKHMEKARSEVDAYEQEIGV